MPFRFLMSGGNFLFSAGPGASGIAVAHNGSITNSAPAGAGDSFALENGTGNPSFTTPNLGGSFQSLCAGFRIYLTALAGGQLIVFNDQLGSNQCDLKMSGTGTLFFTRNGTTISGFSAASIPVNAWTFIEFEAIFSTSGAGTCIARINGVPVLVATAVTNATSTALASQAQLIAAGTSTAYAKDFYVVDGGAASAPFTLTSVDASGNFQGTVTGGAANAYLGYRFTITGFTNAANNPIGAVCTGSTATSLSFSYLTTVVETHAGSAANYGATGLQGDVRVAELFANGPGVHGQWAPNVGPFTLTSVNGSGVYQGTITGGAGNAYVGYNFNITGFVNGANNPTGATCTASSATSITFGALTTVIETHAGSAAFECIVEIGINQTGTRPNGDVAYISDSTAGDISDFVHQALILSGSVLAAAHLSYMRKDDAGTRQVAQLCLSSSATEQSAPISLGTSYEYFVDILEIDPNTGSGWTTASLNAATFGVRELT